jgi:hypothetical protein
MNDHEINTLLPDSSLIIAQSGKTPGSFWPLSNQRRFFISKYVTNTCLQFLEQKSGSDLGDLALLNFGGVFSKARYWCELGELVQLERTRGLTVAGQSSDLVDLRYIIADKSTMLPAVMTLKHEPSSHAFLYRARAFARRLTFFNLSDLPLNVFRKSQTVAISHNELLIADARRNCLNHGYVHANTILQMIRNLPVEKVDPNLGADIIEAAKTLSENIIKCLNTDEDICQAVKLMLRTQIKSSLMEASLDWDRAKLASFIPMNIFCGTGGNYAVRLICMSASRRGGHITSYGHGYFSGLAGQAESFLLSDIAIANEFVVETQRCASNLSNQLKRIPYKSLERAQVRGFDGVSPLKGWIHRLERRKLNTKSPKVLYLPTVLLGARQFFPPLLPDAIYLNWQFKLAQKMSDAGFDLTIRPHPEGAYKGKEHPLEKAFKIEGRLFERCLLDYDILVFDYGQSTLH